MHFVAEINLSALPQEMEQAGHHYEVPAFPTNGLLFLFLSQEGNMA